MIRRPVTIDRDPLHAIRGNTITVSTSANNEYLVSTDKGSGGFIPGDILSFMGSDNLRKVIGVGVRTDRSFRISNNGLFLILMQVTEDGRELDIRINSSSSHLREAYTLVKPSPIMDRTSIEQVTLDDD